VLKGRVNENDEPVVSIDLILRTKPSRYDAIIDTGFNGYLSVPHSLVRKSSWYFAGVEEYELATGERVEQQVYLGHVVFDRRPLQVYVVTSNSKDILIGTKLLRSKRLMIDFDAGTVVIKNV
jgi:clan AA aspartic protease